jgi:formamidopyrimidine-DNA glycosylase
VTQLPEVEVARKALEREVVGKRIKAAEVKTAALVTRHRNRPELYRALEGRKIDAVARRGGALLLDLDDDTTFVLVMGEQSWITRETASAAAAKTTQLVATFTTGGALHYHDVTKTGAMFVVPDEQLGELEELTPGGIDPLADTFTWPAFNERLVERARPLRVVLTDPSVLIGLGATYADEVLWSAGLSGTRPSDSLSAQEVRRLYRSVLEVLYEAVKQGGATERESTEGSGEESDSFINVFGRKGEACRRCRTPIRYEEIGGELSYFCPACQT